MGVIISKTTEPSADVVVPPTTAFTPTPEPTFTPTPPAKPAAPIAVPEAKKAPSELDSILKKIAKDKGPRVVIPGSSVPIVQRIPTGWFEFDLATGGGYPRGRLSIIYGPESSCKTNTTFRAIAEVQRRKHEANKAILINLEQTYDPAWSARFGVDTDELSVVNAGYGEEAADIIDAVVRAEDVGIIVVDSIAVLTAAREVEASTEKMDVGTQATLVKRICNKLAIAFAEEQRRDHFPTVIFVNQTRFKIGMMFGDPETMPGGQTMKFMSALTIRVSGKDEIKKEVHPSVVAFKKINAVIKKAKVGILQKNFEFDVCMYGHDGLNIGETDSWSTVAASLKESGDLRKDGSKWLLWGEHYQTLGDIKDRYREQLPFQLKTQKAVIDYLSPNAFIVEDPTANG